MMCIIYITIYAFISCVYFIRHELSVPREHCINYNYLSSSKVIHNYSNIDCIISESIGTGLPPQTQRVTRNKTATSFLMTFDPPEEAVLSGGSKVIFMLST